MPISEIHSNVYIVCIMVLLDLWQNFVYATLIFYMFILREITLPLLFTIFGYILPGDLNICSGVF